MKDFEKKMKAYMLSIRTFFDLHDEDIDKIITEKSNNEQEDRHNEQHRESRNYHAIVTGESWENDSDLMIAIGIMKIMVMLEHIDTRLEKIEDEINL